MKRRIALALVFAGALVTAAPASAENRFAHPAGTANVGPCTQQGPTPADICTIAAALAASTSPDDVTLLGPGTYPSQGSILTIPNGVTLHGSPGSPATVPFTATDAFDVGSGSALRDVRIEHTGGGVTLRIDDPPALTTVERVYAVRNTVTSGGPACSIDGATALIRDSVCFNTAASGSGGAVDVLASNAEQAVATLRNVTAVATATGGAGIFTDTAIGGQVRVHATNAIVQGQSEDIFAGKSFMGGGNEVILDHSNYDTVNAFSPGVVITPPGTAGNVTTPPAFVDAGAGNFEQQATSTGTIDLGTAAVVNGFGLGSLALSGELRCMGAAPDIGADEFEAAPCGTGSATAPPAGPTGERAAALKRCKKKAKKRDWSKKRLKRCKRKARLLPE